jgi:hypothetical protein
MAGSLRARSTPIKRSDKLPPGCHVLALFENEHIRVYVDAVLLSAPRDLEAALARDEDAAVLQVEFEGGKEGMVGVRRVLPLSKVLLAYRQSRMTGAKLAQAFPKLRGAAARAAGEDQWCDGFLEAWLQQGHVGGETAQRIRAAIGTRNTSIVDRILAVRDQEPGVLATRKLRVKWDGCSYRHAAWVERKVLTHIAFRKLKNFEKALEQQASEEAAARSVRRAAGVDSDDDDEALDVVDGVQAAWLLVDRVVAKRQGKFLVKWQQLPYDEATWETGDVLFTPDDKQQLAKFQDLAAKYQLKAQAQQERAGGDASSSSSSSRLQFHELPAELPYLRGGELFGYQREGLAWLRRKQWEGTNVILADEMGLGKTVQVVALTGCGFFERRSAARPFFIVVPLSTLPHWIREYSKWTPQLNVVAYHGNAQARSILRSHEFDPLALGVQRFDVLVTSYEIGAHLRLPPAACCTRAAAAAAAAAACQTTCHAPASRATISSRALAPSCSSRPSAASQSAPALGAIRH